MHGKRQYAGVFTMETTSSVVFVCFGVTTPKRSFVGHGQTKPPYTKFRDAMRGEVKQKWH